MERERRRKGEESHHLHAAELVRGRPAKWQITHSYGARSAAGERCDAFRSSLGAGRSFSWVNSRQHFKFTEKLSFHLLCECVNVTDVGSF